MANPLLKVAAGVSRLLPAPLKGALYRLGPISRGLRGLLNRAAPVGLSEAEVASGALRGAILQLDLQAEKDYWLGSYEMELQAAAQDLIEPGMVVYDLGANIGYLSLLAARLARAGQVFAFEALPANLARLKANIALNPDLAPIVVVPQAVAATSGQATFRVHASGAMGKLETAAGRQEDYAKQIAVETISLDDFVYCQGHVAPDLIKIDIEGGEGPALQGAARLLQEARPLLLIELHGPEAARAVWEQLAEADYRLQRLGRGQPPVARVEDLDWKSYLLARPNNG